MKKLLVIAFSLFAGSFTSKSASIVVQEYGNCPSCTPAVYGSIDTAVTHANSGDTIFIQNRAGNLPWIESVLITKSLDIVPFTNDSIFYCQGAWTITPSSAGQIINIVGMYNTAGSVSATAAAPAGTRTTVRILGGQIGTGTANYNSGWINFNYNNYDVTVYGMKIINGTSNYCIAYQHGNIIGDSIWQAGNAYAVYVTNDAAATTDTSFIMGNIINLTDGNYNAGIWWTSSYVFFDIRNNLIYSADYYGGIYVGTSRAVNSAVNKIYNNTMVSTYSNQPYGLYLSPGTSSVIEIQNNVLARNATAGTNGIYNTNSNATVDAYYNYIDKNYSTATYQVITGATNTNNNNIVSIGNSLGIGTGLAYPISTTYPPASTNSSNTTSLGYYMTTLAFPGINGGNPGNSYFNLDLTQNTVGCYGGSYTLKNYFPMNVGATRVFLTNYPAAGNIGTNINIKATSFDR